MLLPYPRREVYIVGIGQLHIQQAEVVIGLLQFAEACLAQLGGLQLVAL
jgi:hypothetical protein